jgi:hypothetical protein
MMMMIQPLERPAWTTHLHPTCYTTFTPPVADLSTQHAFRSGVLAAECTLLQDTLLGFSL